MRPVTSRDHPVIVDALQQLLFFSNNYGWVGKPDLARGVMHVLAKQEEGNAYIGHGYLLLVSEFEPWYGTDRVLQEELVLRLPGQPDGEYAIRRVLNFLELLAALRGVDKLLVGNSYTDSVLTRIYERRGFSRCSDILYKDVPHGTNSEQTNGG